MWVSYYREPGVPDNNFSNMDVPLQLNCAGCNLFTDMIHASSVRLDYYLFYLNSGEIKINAPKTENPMMRAGDLIVYEADTPFAYQTNEKPPTEHYFAHFTGFSAGKLLKQCRIPLNTVCHINDRQHLLMKFHAVFETFLHRDAFFSPDSAQKLTDLLITIGRDITNSSISHTYETTTKVQKSLAFIREHFTEDITVEQLAGMEFLSPSRYRTIFRGVMQQSPQEYIIQLRLSMACTLLANTKYSISETAQAVGYTDPRYFSRLFRLKYGMTPTQYRCI